MERASPALDLEENSLTHRQCSIEITNKCSQYTLCNPSYFTESGSCAEPLPYRIDSSSSGSGLFIKTPNAARGAVGVFTYDLINKSTDESTGKIAVMFSVPYDFNLHSNWYAVGIFGMWKECNYDLYYQMYYNNDSTFVRSKAGHGIKHSDKGVTIMATMSDTHQPEMKVEVRDNDE
ncbi:DELTA-sagatoxin-Srs1a-like isoform X2 [Centropristis striata]|nr:DELTA-sagatoxin-Srs1a-like isoform X2 [Centropristis striata]XP_059183621.1 DELTA-sagatoxin-Srs1a-like isoform X2 [Centropristis striata]